MLIRRYDELSLRVHIFIKFWIQRLFLHYYKYHKCLLLFKAECNCH